MITLYLVSHGLLAKPSLYLSAHFEKHRGTYYDSLTRVRESNDIGHWVRFVLQAVYETAEKAVNRARSGQGPSLIEFKTYRWRGHFEGGGMPDLRPKDEVEEWKKKCPVAFMERLLIEKGLMDADELRDLDAEIMSQVQEAVEFAIKSPIPDPEDALEDIFSK